MKKSLLFTTMLNLIFIHNIYAIDRAPHPINAQYMPGRVHHINNEQEFNVIKQLNNVVIDFYADWCNPCRRLSPILEKLAAENPHILFFKINYDAARGLGEKYNVRGIPNLIFLKNGQLVEQVAGLLSKDEYNRLLNRIFSK